ncbi:10362_t:CDS:2, partial [Dentiscutata heterogama]
GSISRNLTVEKKKPNTENLIDLCSEIPINNTIALNKIKKSPDIMPSHSQIKSYNIHLSTETQKIRENYSLIDSREVILQSNIGGDNMINKTDMSIKTRSINHITHSVEIPIVTSDIQIKRKKLRSKTN